MKGNLMGPCYVYGRLNGDQDAEWHVLLPSERGIKTCDGREVAEINGCCIVPMAGAYITGVAHRGFHEVARESEFKDGRIVLKEDA